jgi:hypothetical protein
VCSSVGAGALAGISWLTKPEAQDWLAERLAEVGTNYLAEGSVEIDLLRTDLYSELEVGGIEFLDAQGKRMIFVDRVSMRMDPARLHAREVWISMLEVQGPVLNLVIDEDGSLNILQVIPEDEEESMWSSLLDDWTVQVDAIQVEDAELSLRDHREEAPLPEVALGMESLDMIFERDSEGLHLDGLEIMVQVEEPFEDDLRVQGALTYDGSGVEVDYLSLSLSDLSMDLRGTIDGVSIDPYFGIELQQLQVGPELLETLSETAVLNDEVQVSGRIDGPLAAIHSELTATLPEGLVEIRANADLEAQPPAWVVEVRVQDAGLQALTPMVPLPLLLNIAGRAEGTGLDPFTDMDASWMLQEGRMVVNGEELPKLRASGTLLDGRVMLDESELQHELGIARLKGDLNLDTMELGVALRASLPSLPKLRTEVLRYQAELELPSIDEGALSVDIRMETDLSQSDLEASFTGSVELRDLRLDGMEVAHVEIPIRGEGSMTSAEVNGSLYAQRISQEEVSAAELNASQWVAHWSPDAGLSLDSDLFLRNVSMGGDAVVIREIEGEIQGGQDSGSAISLAADLNVRDVAMGPAGYRAEGGEVRASLEGDEVKLVFDLERRSLPFFKGEVNGNLFRQEWSVQRLVLAPRSDRPLVGARPVRFRLADGGIRDLDLALLGAAGAIQIQGDWLEIHSGQTRMSLEIQNLDIPYVLDVIGLYDPSLVSFVDMDQVQGRLSMRGEIEDRGEPGVAIDGGAEIEGLIWEDLVDVDRVAFDTTGWLERPDIGVEVHDEQGLLLRLDGSIPLESGVASLGLACGGELDLEGVLTLSDHSRLARAVPLLEIPDGQVGATFGLRGDPCDPRMDLTSAGQVLLGAEQGLMRYDVDVHRDGERIDLEVVLEEGLISRVKIEGELETGLSDVLAWTLQPEGAATEADEPDWGAVETWLPHVTRLAISPLNLPVSTIARYIDLPSEIEGSFGGGLTVSGDLRSPRVEGALVLVNGRVGGAEVDSANVILAPDEGGYNVYTMLASEGLSIDIQGFVPLELDLNRGLDQDLTRPGLSLAIGGTGLPLSMAMGVVEDVAEAEGNLWVEGEILGTLAAPEPHIEVKTEDASFAYSVTGVRYPRVDLWARLVDDTFFVHRLEMESEPLWSPLPTRSGSVSVSGHASLDGFALDKVSMKAAADAFWLSYIPMAALQVDGDIEISGRTPELVFRGTGTLVDGRMNFEESWFIEELDLSVDTSISLFRAGTEGVEHLVGESESDFWDPFDIDIEMDLDRNLRMVAHIPMEYAMGSQLAALSTVSTDVELDGQEVHVIWKDGEPNLEGTVEVFDGTMYMLGRQFKVGAGEVSWVGGDFLDPLLDLQATKTTRGYGDITTYLGGSLDNMEVRFDSQDYPDQTDILSILMLGKPASELAGSEGQVGAQMLGAALAMAAGRQFSRAVGSSFMGQVELDQDALKVGFPIGEKAFIELQRRSKAEPNENVMEVRLEWLIMQKMYMEFVSGDHGQGSADLYRRWRF